MIAARTPGVSAASNPLVRVFPPALPRTSNCGLRLALGAFAVDVETILRQPSSARAPVVGPAYARSAARSSLWRTMKPRPELPTPPLARPALGGILLWPCGPATFRRR